MSDTFGYETRKARKTHECYWCGKLIAIGDDYERWVYRDGVAVEVKVHPECGTAWLQLSTDEGYPVEIGFAEFSRGCTCPRGNCQCD